MKVYLVEVFHIGEDCWDVVDIYKSKKSANQRKNELVRSDDFMEVGIIEYEVQE